MERLYLIDGSGFIFRAYHSLPPLNRSDGTPTGAVYGFINMILKLVEGADATHMAVIFDAGRTTFRNRIYPQYKAHRPPAPEDLVPQFPLVREATVALGLPSIELADYEADDIIATYTRLARGHGMEVVIVSSDKDLMQLIGHGVSMYDGMKQKVIGPEQVIEKFGVGPDKVHDVLALIGDSSDNVPGVPGIGPKTAAELIAQFGDLEGVLARASEIRQPKRREAIEQNIDKARLSYELIGLCDTVPTPATLDDFALKKPEHGALLGFLRQMEFKSLVSKFEQKFGIAPSPASAMNRPAASPEKGVQGESAAPRQYELVQDEKALARWITAATSAGIVAFDTETTSLNAMQAELVGFSLSIAPGKACYVPVGHKALGSSDQAAGNDLFSSPAAPSLLPDQIPLARAIALLKPLLADTGVLKIGHNIKYDMLVLRKYGVTIAPVEDTMLLSYVLNAGRGNHNMDDLAQKHLDHTNITYDEVTGTGKARISFAEVALDKALAYAAEDADVTFRLWQALKPQVIERHLVTLYETIERPLIPVIVAMEERGIRVDPAELSSLSSDFGKRIMALEQEIYQLVGHPFNIGSPKQLGEVLFEEMQLPGGKKSKAGSYSTGADVLDELAEAGHPLPMRVLDWRQLSKLKSTYTDALAQEINPVTGRVHTSYAMAVTSTGRLSSSDPNLQNIPIRTEEGRKIRHAFVAQGGRRLISADYSQIELRLLAHIAGIDTLKEAFRNGQDIHAITASQMFGVPVGAVASDLRRKAKTINFGIIYGISAHGLAARLGISRGEAATYIDAYFKQYPGIVEYMERTRQFAREHGYVTTLFGRVCHLPGIHDKNPSMRNFSERAAINAPLQGTAADIIKRAMIGVERMLAGTGARMLLQVHDELVVEAPAAEADMAALQVKRVMEDAAHLSVPLTVETFTGSNWNEAH
jgi:DNA polymerase-1